MSKGIIKIEDEINKIGEVSTISVIGDPGCDGLGAGTMSVFAKALTAVPSDFTVIVGDIVHRGIKPLYSSVTEFVNSIARNPVYMVCGNHDTAFYDDFFGRRNYLLYNDKLLYIILDNSKRDFTDESISFLKNSLENYARKNIVISFHYPAPNTICSNSINPNEWKKISSILSPYNDQIRFIITGHIHSYYEDIVESKKLIVTGGGGARIEYINDKIDPQKAQHHIIRLFFDQNDILQYEYVPLQMISYDDELEDETLKNQLERAYSNESMAHIKYKLFAADALEKGFPGIAKMFSAFAESEFIHARNHFYVLNKLSSVINNVTAAQHQETYEIEKMYKDFLQYSVDKKYGLARYTYYDSYKAECVHDQLLQYASDYLQKGKDIEIEDYYTCTSCGYTFKGTKPDNCPVCGAPRDRILIC